jgi:hypothetical protein
MPVHFIGSVSREKTERMQEADGIGDKGTQVDVSGEAKLSKR